MNSLPRTLAKIAASQSHKTSRRWVALPSFSTSTTSKLWAKSKKPSDSKPSAPKEWPRPTKIPYQSKVANSVSLSSYILMPVQFKAASDGKFWAATVISQNPSSDSPPLWIPIIFEGDLAHIAACHLKINEKYPDFKHKETGKALWLTYAPAWVESKLASLKSKKWCC